MISRTLVIIGASILLTLSGVSMASATTAEGSQNPDLTVSVSLASRNPMNPDEATIGDTVDVAISVKNNKPWSFQFRIEEVLLRITLQAPSLQPFTVSGTIFLLPDQTVRIAFDFPVVQFLPPGPYSLTLEATEVRDPSAPQPSSATAMLTIR
jgi:hypothetical protein